MIGMALLSASQKMATRWLLACREQLEAGQGEVKFISINVVEKIGISLTRLMVSRTKLSKAKPYRYRPTEQSLRLEQVTSTKEVLQMQGMSGHFNITAQVIQNLMRSKGKEQVRT